MIKIRKATKKPVTIEFVEFTGTKKSIEDVRNFMDVSAVPSFKEKNKYFITISTLEGQHEASPGDMIIKGVKGEFYPCKPDIFRLTYTEVQ